MTQRNWISVWLLLLCYVVSAQPPEWQIVRYGWSHYRQGNASMETGMPGASAPGTRMDSTPITRTNNQAEMMRQGSPSKEIKDAYEERRQQEQRPQVKIYSDKKPTAQSRYKYTLELKNSSAKQIVQVHWDYVFLAPRQPQQEALRHQFVSEVKIKPGQTTRITAYTDAAPYGVVDAKRNDQANERVYIKQIVYADGSGWQQP